MDVQILEWVVQKPEDWWLSTRSTVYTWGKGSWHQLGHSTRERVLPSVVEEWQDVRQVRDGGREGGSEEDWREEGWREDGGRREGEREGVRE